MYVYIFSWQLLLVTTQINFLKEIIPLKSSINSSINMGKKMKLIPFIFKRQWPSCKQPKTLSFRAGDDIFKTVNSVFLEPADSVETPETWFTNSPSESVSISGESQEGFGEESLEMIIRSSAQSERLFYEPEDTSSLIVGDHQKAKYARGDEALPFEESVAMTMESEDPYTDFKSTMQEMVETHGLKDWECLQELLGWYLTMNAEKHHGVIVEAFVDLLIGIAAASSSSSSASSSHHSTPLLFSTDDSSLLSCFF